MAERWPGHPQTEGIRSPMSFIESVGFQRIFVLRVLDLALIAGAFAVSAVAHWGGLPDTAHVAMIAILVGVGPAALQVAGAYEFVNFASHSQSISRALTGWGMLLVLLMVLGYAFRVTGCFPRAVVAPWVAGVTVGLALERVLVHQYIRRLHRLGKRISRVLLVGRAAHCRRVAMHFARHPELGLRAIGAVCADADDDDRSPAPIIGDLRQLADKVEECRVQRV